MSCPTCSAALQLMYQDRIRTILHCSTCGTMRSVFMGHTDDAVPALVTRCREFQDRLPLVTAGDGRPWRTLGIAESINPPGARGDHE